MQDEESYMDLSHFFRGGCNEFGKCTYWLGALLHWGDVVPCVKGVQYFAVKDFQIVAEKTELLYHNSSKIVMHISQYFVLSLRSAFALSASHRPGYNVAPRTLEQASHK